MSRIAADEARGNLAQLVKERESSQEIIIVNRGEPLARLESPEPGHDVEQALMAMQRIRERAKRMNLQVTPEEIKSWIEEGRP